MKIKAKSYRNVIINFYGKDVEIGIDGIVDLEEDMAKAILADFSSDWFDPANPPKPKQVEIKEDDPEKEIKVKKILDENVALSNKIDSLKKDLENQKSETDLWKNEFNTLKDKSGTEVESSMSKEQIESLYDLFHLKKAELNEMVEALDNVSEEEVEGLNTKELAILIAFKTL